MKNVFSKFGFLVLLAVVVVGFSGCGEKGTDTVEQEQGGDEAEVTTEQTEEIVEEGIERSGEGEDEQDEESVLEPGEEIDTSNWLTYRNEGYGFEVKYPSDWFCGRASRDWGYKDNKKIVCLSSKLKKDYYLGNENGVSRVMISVVDKQSMIDNEDQYGVISKTIKGDSFNVQVTYFPSKDQEFKKIYFNIIKLLKVTK